MSKKKDQLKKQLKRRKARQQELLRADPGSESPQRAAAIEKLVQHAGKKEDEPVPTDPVDRWWYDFRRTDTDGKLQMVRDVLPLAENDPEQRENYFPDALDSLTSVLSIEDHARFLEELQNGYPQVFDSELEWNTFFLSFRYVDQQQWAALDALIARHASQMTGFGSTFFALVSLLRLAGRDATAQQMVDAGMRCLAQDNLMPWAVNELFEWAVFPMYERCVQEGVKEEILDEIYQFSLDANVKPSEKVRRQQREVALRKVGQGKPWTRELLSKDDRKLPVRTYMLYVDFARWLRTARGLPSVVADELRFLIGYAFDDRDWERNAFLEGIDRRGFDRCLKRYFGMMSLDRVRGPATVLAMHQFFDFLVELELLDESIRKSSQRVCKDFWKDLQQRMGENWKNYRFLEQYWS